MKCERIFIGITAFFAVVSGADFLTSGNAGSFLAFIIFILSSAFFFFVHESDLDGGAMDLQIEEMLKARERMRKDGIKIMLTKSAIRRELIKAWEKID